MLLSIVALAFLTPQVHAQLKSEVSECMELVSVVFRLVGAEEYVNNQLPDYVNSVDDYFASYTRHPLLAYLKEIRKEYGIGYNAVAAAGVCLVIRNGKVQIHPDVDIFRINKFDYRWNSEAFKTFVTQLDDFYRKTNFRNFYLQHTDLYEMTVERMDVLLKNIHKDWFVSFFGEELKEDTKIIVSLCNGPNNYSVLMPGKKEKGGLIIGTIAGRDGLPLFDNNKIFTIIHELSHHYTNRRINDYWDQIEPVALKIFPYVKEMMGKIAYGDVRTVMTEWFTNLCTVLYAKENPGDGQYRTFEQLIGVEQYRGFIWMDRSVLFMKHFYENRNLYATIDDYMIQIVGHLCFIADNFDYIIKEYENRLPYIVDVFPAPSSTISQDINTIEIRFSQEMNGSYGMDIVEDENIIQIPFSKKPFWKDECTIVFPFDSGQLEKGKTYGFKLLRPPFQNKKMFAIKEDYIYTFKTKE